jgi:hypothetical protein
MSDTETSHTERQAAERPTGFRSRYQLRSPVVVLAATTIVALFGGALLNLATEWSNPLVGLIGVVIATGAAWVTTDYTAAKWRTDDTGKWKGFVLVAALLGCLGLWLADNVRSTLGSAAPMLGFASLMALTLAIGPLVGEVRDGGIEDADRWMRDGLVVGFVSSIVIGSPVPTPVRMVAMLALLGGFGFLTGGLSTMCAHRALPKSRVLKIVPGDARQRGIIVGGIGLAIVLSGLIVGWTQVVAVGSWLTLVAMVMLSVRPARFGMSTLMERSVLGAGVLLVAVAGYQLYVADTVGRSGFFASFLALTIALAGAWIVWRGSTLFIVVVLGFAFVWGLFPHTTFDENHVSAVSNGDAQTSGIVAFGDSYISGEGATDYFSGTDVKGAENNECRRAPTAYPVLVAEQLTEASLDFYACSGAKLGDVLALCADDPALDEENVAAMEEADDESNGPALAGEMFDEVAVDSCAFEASEREQQRRAELGCSHDDQRPLGQYPCGAADVYGSTLQTENLPGNRSATELVLLSIGGNDVRFGDIVAGCLLPGSCVERREIWLDNVAALGPELTEAYVSLREEFDDVPIVVMPYPLVLTEQTCDSSPLDASEHEFIFEFTTVLNRQIATSAKQAGVYFFDEGVFSLEGRRLCESDERGINLIRLQPTDGPLLDRLDPASWTHNSMHPNRRGHEMIAAALMGWLESEEIVGSGNPDAVDVGDALLLDVRTARPHAVAPSVAASLRSTGPPDCDVSQIGSFGTRIAVSDEQPGNGADAEAFRVPVAGADPTSTICVTNSAGEWMPLVPMQAPDAGGGPSMTRLPSADPVAEIRGDSVFVTGGRPGETCGALRGAAFCEFQWLLFASPQDDPAVEPTWSLRAVRYCSVDPECEDTFGEWTDAQISRAVRQVAPTTGLIFLGGWLLALGLELVLAPRAAAFVRPKLSGSIVRPGDSHR